MGVRVAAMRGRRVRGKDFGRAGSTEWQKTLIRVKTAKSKRRKSGASPGLRAGSIFLSSPPEPPRVGGRVMPRKKQMHCRTQTAQSEKQEPPAYAEGLR